MSEDGVAQTQEERVTRGEKPPRRLPGMNAGMDTVRRTFVWPLYGMLVFPIFVVLVNGAQFAGSGGLGVLGVVFVIAVQAGLAAAPMHRSLRGFPWLERNLPPWWSVMLAGLIVGVGVAGAVVALQGTAGGNGLELGPSRWLVLQTGWFLVCALGAYIGPVIAAVLTLGTVGVSVSIGQAEMTVGGFIAVFFVVATPWLVIWSSLWYIEVLRSIDRVRQQESVLAVAEERLRISRDLHDVLGRRFSAIAVKSELGAQLALREGGEGSKAATQFREVRQLAHDSLADMRGLVQSYRKTNLDQELSGARSLLASAGVDVHLTGSADAVPPAHRDLAARVLREAVTNVLRHSRASQVSIMIDPAGLRVENDGVGASRVKDRGGGTGLATLRDRLAEAGGRLRTGAEDGWFRVHAQFAMAREVPGEGTAGR